MRTDGFSETDAGGATSSGSAIVDCAVYQRGVRQGGQVPLDVALERAQALVDGFVWIGLYEPSAAEFDAVTAEFGLHPLAVEDAVHAHQRPKLEHYGDSLFAVLKTARYVDEEEAIEIGELMIFLGANFIVTVRHGGASALRDVRHAAEANPTLLGTGPSGVLYAIADHVVDEYAVVANGISEDIEEIELQVFSGDRRQNPTERLYKLKREVLQFRRAVGPLVQPLERIAGGGVELIDARTAEYFRDVADHVVRALERVDTHDELLSGVLAANQASIQVRQNEDMRKITAWVAILAANTLLAGGYGMNFEHMPELGWRYGYLMVMLAMAAISVVLYRGFRRSGWI